MIDAINGGGGQRSGIEHADLQRIEAGNIEFEAHRDAAALLLGAGGDQPTARSQMPPQGIIAQARTNELPLSWSSLQVVVCPVFRIVTMSTVRLAGICVAGKAVRAPRMKSRRHSLTQHDCVSHAPLSKACRQRLLFHPPTDRSLSDRHACARQASPSASPPRPWRRTCGTAD